MIAESAVLKQQALFMSRIKKMEDVNMEKLQRSVAESKHLHDALNVMRGDLRRCEVRSRQDNTSLFY